MAEQETDQISFRHLVIRLRSFFNYLFVKKWWIIGSIIVSVLFALVFNTLKKKEFTSETTFVLQNEAESLEDISSLASFAGVNLGALSESGGLFQIDNIQELYQSHRMISKTMMTRTIINNQEQLLVHRYIDAGNKRKKWKNNPELNNIDFSVPSTLWTIKHDSLLLEFTKEIREDHLTISKPSRKLTILNVSFTHKDEHFAKAFNEALVTNVNSFYRTSKTKKSGDNLRILQLQADSVKQVLDNKVAAIAVAKESAPNLNPLYKSALVAEQKIMIDISSTSAVYEVIVKNLELAKISHRNNTPLIQIIDFPILPLENNKWKVQKTVMISAFLGLFLSVFFFSIKRLYLLAMEEE